MDLLCTIADPSCRLCSWHTL